MRYVPQLWFIPVLEESWGWTIRTDLLVVGGMLAGLWVNIGLYTCQTVSLQMESTRRIQQTLMSYARP